MTGFTAADMDRCPHGRHVGDDCAGWRGPRRFDGGCEGGTSLGNPWWRMAGTRAGTTMGGQHVETTEARTLGIAPVAEGCAWAPLSHDAGATHEVTIERPCGHDRSVVPSCRMHFMDKRARPTAGRATECSACGEVNLLSVVETRRLPVQISAEES
jgi:hypothetical protein